MASPKITTIKIEKPTKDRLDGLKEYHRETYDDLIKKILNIINITIRSPTTGARIFRNIKHKKRAKERGMTFQPPDQSESEE